VIQIRPYHTSLESTTCPDEPAEKRSHNEQSEILMRS